MKTGSDYIAGIKPDEDDSKWSDLILTRVLAPGLPKIKIPVEISFTCFPNLGISVDVLKTIKCYAKTYRHKPKSFCI